MKPAPYLKAIGSNDSTAALAWLRSHGAAYRRELETLCRIPGLSSAPAPSPALRQSAKAVAKFAKRVGLEHVAVIERPGVHPYVCADWLHAPGQPTVLLYSHHDVQPTGNPALWRSAPFAPAVRGGRLYARGAADDKAGVAVELAAIGSYLQAGRPLPCNVRVLIDGEEEIGSPHFADFIADHRERVAADVVVVFDTSNLAIGTPAITRSLRGGCLVDVEVRCLEAALHSGRGGGLVPDPIQVLCRLIARLQDEKGALQVRDVLRDVPRLAHGPKAGPRAPFSLAQFRRDTGLLPGVRLAGDPRVPPNERLWSRPALTVIAFEAPHLVGSSNQIVPSARARLSLRLAAGMDGKRAGAALVRALQADPPCGARVSARLIRSTWGWRTDVDSGAHRAAVTALTRGYGRRPVYLGAGGGIGFVDTIARELGGAPCVLLGIEDPDCRAHSENESLHLGDWDRATRSLIHFLHELPRA
jgi:cysteinylglycine-S-conjugate dipeptidase